MVTALPLLALLSVPPLEGCVAKPDGFGWEYHCQDLFAGSRDEPGEKGSVEELRARLAESIRKVTSPPETRWVGMPLAGRTEQVLVASFEDRTEYYAALKRPEGRRMLMCKGASATCAAVLDTLASAGWGTGPADGAQAGPSARLQFLGRDVTVPSECRGTGLDDGGGDVVCPHGFQANWTAFEDGGLALRTLEQATQSAARSPQATKVRQDTVPCRAGEGLVTCRRIRAETAGHPYTVLLGIVPAAKGVLVVACNSPGETGEENPCALVVAPGVPALAVGGVPVAVPDGCLGKTTAGGGKIDCPTAGTFATWKAFPLGSAKKMLDELEAATRETVSGGEVRRDTLPCTFAATQTTCRRVQAAKGGKVYAFNLMAAVPADDRTLVGFCLARADDRVPCSAILEAR